MVRSNRKTIEQILGYQGTFSKMDRKRTETEDILRLISVEVSLSRSVTSPGC